jgi:hypothetical protein
MKSIATLFLILFLTVNIIAQENPETTQLPDTSLITIAPPTSVIAEDFKYDNAEKLSISWVQSVDDQPGDYNKVIGYKIYRFSNGGDAELIAELPPGKNYYLDEDLEDNIEYSYYVSSLSENYEAQSNITEPLTPEREWLNFDLKFLFLIAFIIASSVIYYIWHASKGKKLFVRKIAGLEAVDEAIGRATEMGRPILFIPGIHDMDDVQTLAAITILGKVAKQIADYDTKIRMPVARSLVMTAARETIKAAYQTAGRPDAYSDDMVNYVTDEQFGYVAAVDGIMVREKPATIFLLGAFFAESLILAETGNSVGAIQIAGTARPAQLPFFIAACDFTLIGEELFAASAYLSGEPKMLGSLRGQDIGKAIAMAVIVIGVLSATFGEIWEVEFLLTIKQWLLQFFTVR